ncbi:MAG: nucleoside 2-deoxyribosyltransferase [Bacteroidales bacterium]|nr:MAG: nucleoside 2-deoxyribosyltransferase [Bacteroidales bacterium]
MKIYFSGSIRGGQQDTDLYAELIQELKQYGTVLTEHIGWKTIDTSLTDQEIHDRDVKWVEDSDIVIAEVTVPSLGVGYEIGRAIDMKKPIICLYRSINGKGTSAMIRGCSNLQCFEYSDLLEAKEILKKQLKTT